MQAVNRENELLGFVAADFSVNDLLRDSSLSASIPHWNQYRGDPAVRGTLFLQQRFTSPLDEHIDEVLSESPLFDCAERREHDGDQPLSRPATKFERRGLRKGHRIWDWRFSKIDL